MNHAAKLRVLVVDDHPLMRRGIVGVLDEAGDIVVVAEASDGFAAQDCYREHRPDVTLMDLSMPRCHGVDAIRAIRRDDPHACILAVSTYAGDGQVHRALEAGAAGYVLKSELCSGVADLVRSAHAGRRVLAPDLTRRLAAGRQEQLTAREHDVLALVAQGLGNRDVARRLGIAEETVKSYLSNVLQKLQASDRTHAVVIALRRGMLD
ncbi:response regulator [Pseudoduganella umbonata]|uniref:DNA-binding NarL/FixJ family response regulator n=1 Tax=Pseudoduganella umbonata TaxID=864828 RepID=A0A4P8HK94_9BURK|nr:response regulator transcription factor [Pseudoduganella umbonata]MBB3225174.1 DNA-binding NarL/FixJ family response regulator [Pseudoduganella umbonata]QCP09296.1 response regulator transcription factor [Pseudoduganella umbonata]